MHARLCPLKELGGECVVSFRRLKRHVITYGGFHDATKVLLIFLVERGFTFPFFSNKRARDSFVWLERFCVWLEGEWGNPARRIVADRVQVIICAFGRSSCKLATFLDQQTTMIYNVCVC